jgi:hypothetical protein
MFRSDETPSCDASIASAAIMPVEHATPDHVIVLSGLQNLFSRGARPAPCNASFR